MNPLKLAIITVAGISALAAAPALLSNLTSKSDQSIPQRTADAHNDSVLEMAALPAPQATGTQSLPARRVEQNSVPEQKKTQAPEKKNDAKSDANAVKSAPARVANARPTGLPRPAAANAPVTADTSLPVSKPDPTTPAKAQAEVAAAPAVPAATPEIPYRADVEEAQKLAQKVAKGKGFDFNDLRSQLQQLQKMGGMGSLLEKLPGGAAAAQKLAPGHAEKELKRQIALIDSMTPRERRRPEIIDGSRRRRIASGAGMQVQDVNRLLKQHLEMQRMMKKMGGGKLARMMGSMAGRFPGMPR